MKTVERIAFGLGILLFAWLLWQIGPAAVGRLVSRVGWGFLAILGVSGVIAVINTLAWRATLPSRERISVATLLGFALAGDAINNLTPSAVVGGDLLRVSLLSRKVPPVTAAASVALAAAVQFLAQVLFILAGLPLAILAIPHGPLRNGFFAAFGAVLVVLAVTVFLGTRGGLFERLHRFLSRFQIFRAHWAGDGSSWRRLDEAVFGAFRQRRGDLAFALLLYFVGWLAGTFEVSLSLFLLGAKTGWVLCLVIETMSVVIDMVLFFVPARAGTQEGGKYAIFSVLSLDPRVGFALGLVKRLRDLAWAAVGLAVLGRWQARSRPR